MQLTRLIASTRLVYLLFLLPPAFLWAMNEGSGGVLVPLALALFAFVHLGIFDTKTLRAGRRQRLAFTRSPGAATAAITAPWATWCALLLAVVTIILLLVATRVGLLVLILGAIVLPLTGGVGADAGPIKRKRMLWAELAYPFGFLILPAWWIGSYKVVEIVTPAEGVTDSIVTDFPLTPETWTITWLCALMLCAYLLTCQIRDQSEDASEGQITTPTLLGRTATTALLLLVLFAVQMVAARGLDPITAGFGLLTPAFAALGGLVALWAVASEADDAAPKIVLLTQLGLLVSFLP